MRLCQKFGKGQTAGEGDANLRLRDLFRAAFLAALLPFGLASTAPAQEELPVDLELVLAVDASGSVDEAEFALQMGGIAYAFRNPAVVEAITQGFHGRIAVNVAIWAESRMPKDSSGWYLIEDTDSAERLARLVERYPRRVEGGTGIGRAITFAVDLFDDNGFASNRRVIDISGDGRETTFRNWSVPPSQARFKANAQQVTINGLVILADDPELDQYYRENVMTGPGSFVMKVNNFQDFPEAMSKKLLREIEYRPNVGEAPQDLP